MKIVLLSNSEESNRLSSWLQRQENVELITHQNKIDSDFVVSHHPDLIVSYNYRYIIRPDVINALPERIINLHISYLPWNRGAHPNVWSFLKDTPKGVTIHLIDEGLDTGDILFQKVVTFNEEKETLASSYALLHQNIFDLFVENWDRIKKCEWKRIKQTGSGSINYVRDFEKIEPLIAEKRWNTPIPEIKRKYQQLLEGDAP